ncbi:hypothetical protein M8494_36285 [Serratia ureilytica]
MLLLLALLLTLLRLLLVASHGLVDWPETLVLRFSRFFVSFNALCQCCSARSACWVPGGAQGADRVRSVSSGVSPLQHRAQLLRRHVGQDVMRLLGFLRRFIVFAGFGPTTMDAASTPITITFGGILISSAMVCPFFTAFYGLANDRRLRDKGAIRRPAVTRNSDGVPPALTGPR